MRPTAERVARKARAVMPGAVPSRVRSGVPFIRKPVFEELERRLLMSADIAPVTAEALFALPAPGGAEFRSLVADSTAVTAAAAPPIQRSTELVFIDPRVPDRERLLAELISPSAAGRHFEIVTLDVHRDGIAQVTEALAGRVQIDAIHFISHGTEGAVQLGRTWLDAKTLGANADTVASWGESLKHDADLLFYGCDLAASARGRALVEWIAELTRGDVAASTDATGASRPRRRLGPRSDGRRRRDRTCDRSVGARDLVASARRRGGGTRLPGQQPVPQCADRIGSRSRRDRQFRRRLAEQRPGRRQLRHLRPAVQRGGVAAGRRVPRQHLHDAAISEAPVGRHGRRRRLRRRVAERRTRTATATASTPSATTPRASPQGGEFRVNTVTTSDQQNPAVAMDADGDFVVAWQSNDQDGDKLGHLRPALQRRAASPQGGEFRVNTYTSRPTGHPRSRWTPTATSSSPGRATARTATTFGIYAQRYNAAGVPQGGEFRVNTFTRQGPGRPRRGDGRRRRLRRSPGRATDQDGDKLGHLRPALQRRAARRRAASSASTPSTTQRTTSARRSPWTPTATSSSPGRVTIRTATSGASTPGATTPRAPPKARSSSSTPIRARIRTAPRSRSTRRDRVTSSSPGPARASATATECSRGSTPHPHRRFRARSFTTSTAMPM